MLDWEELPRCDDMHLPAEFREGEGWFDIVRPSGIAGIRFAVFGAGRAFHPGFVMLFNESGHPMCYLPCDPDVCPTDPNQEGIAFFDYETNVIGHLVFRTRELRTFARGPYECVTALTSMAPDGTALICTRQLKPDNDRISDAREIESRTGSCVEVIFRCPTCSFCAGVPYGGTLPSHTTFKFLGCATCTTVRQIAVDVRDISGPQCDCGADAHLYDDLNCRWVRQVKEQSYVRRFLCPSCHGEDLAMVGATTND